MREFLFRARDKQRREFLSGGEVLIAIQPGKNPKNILYLDILKGPDRYKDRFELEQFTGLTDKNGKKIFEEDIISDGRSGLVEYVPEHASFLVLTHDSDGACYQRIENGNLQLINTEIIGNVHDNPELIGR